MENIDFVVTWVDFQDPVWKAKYNEYRPQRLNLTNNEIRYRDYGTFKYWFRSVEKYAPWVNKIFLVTDKQVPEWLNTNNDKLVIVDHTDFIDPEFLPTFNSSVIELNIANIKQLSEKFVLFNDDMFLNDVVKKEDFFKNGMPVDFGTFQPTMPTTEFTHILINDLLLINDWFENRVIVKKNFKKYFSIKYGAKRLAEAATMLPYRKIAGFYDAHISSPYLKSTFKKVLKMADDDFKKTETHKFRNNNDINEWLIKYYQFCSGQFEPQRKTFGSFYELTDRNYFIQDIEKSKSKVVCVNDVESPDLDVTMNLLRKTLQKKLPNKSSFER
ncbi:Stealth CR1 domain-containing protein [Pediococcus siamensis]|uniref:Stealth CR1 domain-containing protein n=1 Tax=Pediococcus siamensis TaxID=381829 RepID=UPI0039A10EA0